MSRPPPRAQLRSTFSARLNRPCAVVARAPGRVNLIGEHTDYNDGFVLPMALEQNTWVAAATRNDGLAHAITLDLPREKTWPIDGGKTADRADWTSYIAGVSALLRQRGARIDGFDLLVQSDVPVGGGLSSSAALEVATALALSALANLTLPEAELADLCRAAEHEFAGVPCGIMDQYVSVLAQAECALLLDCRTRTWEHIPLALGEHVLLVVNSGVRHELATGEYALRQQQCRQAVEYFQRSNPATRALRDVAPESLQREAPQLDPVIAARARHVISENARTLAAAQALRHGDLAELGQLMSASHGSLRDDYAVSCRQLDALVEIVGRVPGVLGARLTGGGFGGCIVVLAHRTALGSIEAAVRENYDAKGDGPARLLLSRPGPGAARVFP
jgi:galactokinase